MKKESNLIIYDLILYLVFPLVLYKVLQHYFSDYWAMLLPTVPGILYTLFRFWYTKQFNVTGIFIISTLTVSTAVDLLALGSAKNLIVYNVYYHFALVGVFLILLALKKPLPYYFMIDIAAI